MLGAVIGSGIFRAPSAVARHLPTLGPFLAAWAVGGLVSTAGAMVFGELSAAFPVTGGRYVFLREGFGQRFAFCYAWLHTVLLHPASVGAAALVFAAYLGEIIPGLLPHQPGVAMATVVVLAAINYRSTRASVDQMVLTSAIKAAAVVAMALLLFAMVPNAPAVPATAASVTTATTATWHGFGLALITIMWTYSGWSSMAYLAGEVRTPGRTMPRVLTGGMAAVIVLFVAVNYAYVHALSLPGIAASPAVAADAMESVLGPRGRVVIAAVVLIATFGALNASILTAPRVAYAMALDAPGLRWLAAIHRLYRTPHVAIALTSALAAAFIWKHTFEELASTFIIGNWPFDVMCAVALYRFRRTGVSRPFGGVSAPVVPMLFVMGAVLMVVNAIWGHWLTAAAGIGLFLLGVPIHLALRRYAAPAAAT
jgi:basic amino acid/polyamine antiporter, APA family